MSCLSNERRCRRRHWRVDGTAERLSCSSQRRRVSTHCTNYNAPSIHTLKITQIAIIFCRHFGAARSLLSARTVLFLVQGPVDNFTRNRTGQSPVFYPVLIITSLK